MPQWAGSCWYELRYLDPTNETALVDPENEAYWMGPRFPGDCGGVDLYVGGAEHAVLHLLYARFWHKVLYDLGHVSSYEPYRRLFNQGLIQAYEYTDRRGQYVDAHGITEHDGAWWHEGEQVNRQLGRMGKSRKNAVAPDEMYDSYGADTLRLYEMFTGPLDQSRPWDTTAIVGTYRLLQRIWRNVVDEDTGAVTVADAPLDPDTERALHRAVDAVREGMEKMRFNVAIAKITELNNHLTARYPDGGVPRGAVEPMVLLLSPLAPHISEELWSRLGHRDSLATEPFPRADPAWLVDETVEVPVQVNGKVRARVHVPADADAEALESAARADAAVAALLEGRIVRQRRGRPWPPGQLRGGLIPHRCSPAPGFEGRPPAGARVTLPHGAVAQLVERVHGMDEVARSIRVGSTHSGRHLRRVAAVGVLRSSRARPRQAPGPVVAGSAHSSRGTSLHRRSSS